MKTGKKLIVGICTLFFAFTVECSNAGVLNLGKEKQSKNMDSKNSVSSSLFKSLVLLGVLITFGFQMAKAQEKKDPTEGWPIGAKFKFKDLQETREVVDTYDPATQYFTGNKEMLDCALSKPEREKYLKGYFGDSPTPEDKKIIAEFNKEFDALAAVYDKKIVLLNPKDNLFVNHNASEEALMKKELPAGIKIHKIGLMHKDFEVVTEVVNGIKQPTKRFKSGYVWGKDPNDKSKYCTLYQINLIQTYEGGGKYGATNATLLENWTRSCPK